MVSLKLNRSGDNREEMMSQEVDREWNGYKDRENIKCVEVIRMQMSQQPCQTILFKFEGG